MRLDFVLGVELEFETFPTVASLRYRSGATHGQLKSKINRGSFSTGFFIKVMRAIGGRAGRPAEGGRSQAQVMLLFPHASAAALRARLWLSFCTARHFLLAHLLRKFRSPDR